MWGAAPRRRVEPPTLEDFGRRPRQCLMWPPRASDVAAVAEVLRVAGPRVVDVGAGTGLLARLLRDEGIEVEAVDPAPPETQYVRVEKRDAQSLRPPYDACIVSWMEAGQDYREAIARLAPVIVNVYDTGGGCGVMGATDFAPRGFVEAAWWTGPSFEDVAFALDRPGRGLRRKGYPGNRIDILTRYKRLAPALKAAVERAVPGAPYDWELEMEPLRL